MLAPIRRRLPSRGRVRPFLRTLSLPRSFGGWLILVVDAAQRVQFTKNLMGRRVLDLVHQWGWLAGILWLGGVVLWAAARPSDAERLRSIDRLRQPIANAIRRFEDLSAAYEKKISEEGIRGVDVARWEFLHGLGNVLKMALDAIPPEHRREYEMMLRYTLLDYIQYHEHLGTAFSGETPPTLPLSIALGIDLSKPATPETSE